MTPKDVIEKWLTAFNEGNSAVLGVLYAPNAVNHQMPNEPVLGRDAIIKMFKDEFEVAPDMHCIKVQIIEEEDWAVLEWKDPKGFRGCGFFHVVDGQIQEQRGYWDKLSFNKLYNFST